MVDFVRGNPAIDAYQRGQEFAQRQLLGDQAVRRNDQAFQFDERANPDRLSSISSQAASNSANARVATETAPDRIAISAESAKQAPIATESAQFNLDHARDMAPLQRGQAAAGLRSANAGASGAEMNGFLQSLELIKQGNVAAARQVAASYGQEIPDEVVNNSALLGSLDRFKEEALERYPNSPQRQKQYIQSALAGLADASQGQARVSDPAFALNVPGAPEPVDVAGGNDAASRKMQALIDGGVAPDQARKIAYGQLRISRDPTTNSVTLVDLGTNEIVPLSTAGQAEGQGEEQLEPAPDIPTPGSPETLFGSADKAVGAGPTIMDMLSGVTGQLTGGVLSPDVTAARQRYSTAQNELIRALVVNPRFNQGEINRVREEIAIDTGILNSPARAEIQMRSLDGSLRRRLVQERETSENNEMPVEVRKNALRAADDLTRFLEVLGVTRIDQMSAEDLNSMDPRNMTESEISRAASRLDMLMGGEQPGAVPEPVSGASRAPVQVQSQEQFDALPSGSLFINPADGRTLQKN